MMRWLLYVVVLWSYGVSLAYAGINHASNLDWKTQESAHFRIHFYEDEQALANRSLHIAESVYQRLTPILNWKPRKKTEIVLTDKMDASNGFAMPIPSNRITLFVSRPNSVNSLEDHAGWLETLILHEFVHTLHLDKAAGGMKGLRHVFGRILLAFPNVFMPPWMHEGLATYYETDHRLGIGRGQSSYFQMLMRMEVESGVKPLGQINQPIVSWPLLTSRYLYGVYFYQYIAETYGEETLPALVQSYSRHWLPFSINTLYLDVIGKDLTQVWAEYKIDLQRKFRPEITKLKAKGLTQAKWLSHTGDFKHSVIQTHDQGVLYVSDNLESGSKLIQIKSLEKPELHTVMQLNLNARLDWHEEAGLLMVQPDTCDNANLYYDIYKVDIEGGHAEQLTSCQRYIFAAWSPDGQRIAVVKNYRGQHALHILDADGKLIEALWHGEYDETLSGLDWSEDGTSLLSSVWRKGSGWDVEEYSIADKTWRKITNDMNIQTDARYVQGSSDIVFSADYGGVYNIYRYADGSLKSQSKLMQLTQVLGGSFSPFVSEKGALFSVDYQAQGFDVAYLEQPLHQVVSELRSLPAKFEYEQFPAHEIDISAPQPYSAWDSVLPTSWLPNTAITTEGVELGVFVFGSDVLGQHSYSLYSGVQSVSTSPVFSFDYVYDGWFPLLKMHAEKMQTPSLDKNNDLIALTEKQRFDVELVFPFLKQQQRWTMHVALNHEKRDVAWLAPLYTAAGFLPYQDTLAGAAVVYDTRLTYPRGISSTSIGYVFSLMGESGQGLGGAYTGNVTMLSGRSFFDLGGEQVLAMRVDAAKGDAKSRPFQLGGVSNSNIIPNLISPLPASASFNQRTFGLRGYGADEPALTGQDMAIASLEYRFPIARIERGFMAPPVGIHQLFGQVFVDAGRAGNNLSLAKTYTGVGAEIGGDLVLFYNLPIRMQFGYAKGLDDVLGGNQVYFRLGSSF